MKKKIKRGKKSPIKTPAFIMYIKGRIDAKKGIDVAQSRLNSLLRKIEVNEANHVIFEEENSKTYRSEACSLVQDFMTTSNHKNSIPEGNDEVAATRGERRFKADIAKMDGIKKHLAQISESLTTNDALLCQHIMRSRNKGYYKIQSYLRGLKSGGVIFELEKPKFEPYEIHESKHHILMDSIKAILTSKGVVI